MITCPYCASENIKGSDECAECGQPLDDEYLAPPTTAVEKSLLKDRVNILMPRQPITVEATTPVGDVLRLLVERRIGCVVVAEGNKPLGIFSERDYARKIALLDRSSKTTTVRQVMTSDLIYAAPTDSMESCMELMTDKRIRHLPVMEDGRLIGLISIGDLVKNIIEDQKAMIQQLEQYVRGETY